MKSKAVGMTDAELAQTERMLAREIPLAQALLAAVRYEIKRRRRAKR